MERERVSGREVARRAGLSQTVVKAVLRETPPERLSTGSLLALARLLEVRVAEVLEEPSGPRDHFVEQMERLTPEERRAVTAFLVALRGRGVR